MNTQSIIFWSGHHIFRWTVTIKRCPLASDQEFENHDIEMIKGFWNVLFGKKEVLGGSEAWGSQR